MKIWTHWDVDYANLQVRIFIPDSVMGSKNVQHRLDQAGNKPSTYLRVLADIAQEVEREQA